MRTIIVSVAKAGHVNQCVAFCERAGWVPEETVRIPAPGRMTGRWERLSLNVRREVATWRSRPRRKEAGRLRIVASGSAAERVVAAYRALYGGDLFAAFSGRPKWPEPIFDLALVPRHSLGAGESEAGFCVPAARRSILRRGVPTRFVEMGPPGTAPVGTLAMIGGVNKAFDVDALRIAEQVRRLIAREGTRPFTIAFSRRTPKPVEAHLRRAFGSTDVRFVDRLDRPGFERAMAEAACYLVTPDSLTMVCEACATGRPVRVFDLACFDPEVSTARCIQDLLEGGEIALAPDGAPGPVSAGLFDSPEEALEVYKTWEAARSL